MTKKTTRKLNQGTPNGIIQQKENRSRNFKSGVNTVLPNKLSHNKLIRLIAENPENEVLWREFTNRFAKLIVATIMRESNRLNFTKGCQNVNDLLQEVYLNLLKNNCRALKNFKGRHKNSIVRYLMISASHVVRTHFSRTLSQKRKQNGETVYIDDDRHLPNTLKPRTAENLRDRNWNAQMRAGELIEEVEYCLKKAIKSSRHPQRDMQIFRYYVYDGFQTSEIADISKFSITEKRVCNLLTEMKKKVSKYLMEKIFLAYPT